MMNDYEYLEMYLTREELGKLKEMKACLKTCIALHEFNKKEKHEFCKALVNFLEINSNDK